MIPVFARAKTVHALNRAATVIGSLYNLENWKENTVQPGSWWVVLMRISSFTTLGSHALYLETDNLNLHVSYV
jgi:hypothetical protein